MNIDPNWAFIQKDVLLILWFVRCINDTTVKPDREPAIFHIGMQAFLMTQEKCITRHRRDKPWWPFHRATTVLTTIEQDHRFIALGAIKLPRIPVGLSFQNILDH